VTPLAAIPAGSTERPGGPAGSTERPSDPAGSAQRPGGPAGSAGAPEPPPTDFAVRTARGLLSVRSVDPVADLKLVHRWMNAPHVVEFWQQGWPAGRLAAYLTRQLIGRHSRPCLGLLAGVPVSYWEFYRPVAEPVGAGYAAAPTDLGVHVLIGDARLTGKGLGTVLLGAVRDGLFGADPACGRIVAEPDVRNLVSVRAFERAGFTRRADITLPGKDAALMIAERPAARTVERSTP
jgi:RimJ/RimL family protein N-acetyltransferase